MSDTPVKPRKTAVDTFVAKDHAAVFWFLVAIFTMGLCGWFVYIMGESMKVRPDFVIMDGTGVFYVAPGDTFDKATEVHQDLTRLAVETIFQRSPTGLVHEKRLPILCTPKGGAFFKGFIERDDADFARDQIQQSVEITEIKIGSRLPTAVATQALGTITRKGIFNGEPFEETRSLDIIFFWTHNPAIGRNKAFPALINEIPKLQMPIISRS
jgi:hypothetical protein